MVMNRKINEKNLGIFIYYISEWTRKKIKRVKRRKKYEQEEK